MHLNWCLLIMYMLHSWFFFNQNCFFILWIYKKICYIKVCIVTLAQPITRLNWAFIEPPPERKIGRTPAKQTAAAATERSCGTNIEKHYIAESVGCRYCKKGICNQMIKVQNEIGNLAFDLIYFHCSIKCVVYF